MTQKLAQCVPAVYRLGAAGSVLEDVTLPTKRDLLLTTCIRRQANERTFFRGRLHLVPCERCSCRSDQSHHFQLLRRQLWKIMMDSEVRTLLKVEIEDTVGPTPS